MRGWLVGAERVLSEDIPAAPETVRDFYVDLENMRLVHPLVVSVRSVARVDTADGYEQTYRVQDRIPFGRLTLPTSYSARLYVPVSGDVVAEARQFPMVRLHTVVTFDGVDGGTRLTERMRIQAPRILAAVTVREAVKAHTAMLAGVRHYFGQRR